MGHGFSLQPKAQLPKFGERIGKSHVKIKYIYKVKKIESEMFRIKTKNILSVDYILL